MATLTRPRFLCDDDDEESRAMLATLLRLAFNEPSAAGVAAQALSRIQAEHFDCKVPEVDDLELCRGAAEHLSNAKATGE